MFISLVKTDDKQGIHKGTFPRRIKQSRITMKKGKAKRQENDATNQEKKLYRKLIDIRH